MKNRETQTLSAPPPRCAERLGISESKTQTLSAPPPRCAEKLGLSGKRLNTVRLRLHSLTMKISRDYPCLYLTSVTNKRLPVFQSDKLKAIAAKAFDEARRSAGLKIFAYVIMPDHYHILTDGSRKPSEVLRYLNGISAKRVIDYLKENVFESSLRKLRMRTKKRGYKHSLWEHHPNAFLVTSENMFMQKVNYIHQNPVRAGFVDHPDDYLYSSSRIWNRKALEEEPLRMDIASIDWRVS